MTKKQLFFTLFSLIFLSKTPSIQCMFRAQSPVRSSFSHNSPATHSLWPRMFLEHNWQKNFELDTVKSITKDIVDAGSTIQKEFAWGLFSAKKEAFRECVKGHLSDNQIHALFDNRREIIKCQLNDPRHFITISSLSPAIIKTIKNRLDHRGINPAYVNIIKDNSNCARTSVNYEGLGVSTDIFNTQWDGWMHERNAVQGGIGINVLDIMLYSPKGQQGVFDHEITHIEEADSRLSKLVRIYNQDTSKEQSFNHYKEFTADQLYSLKDLEAAYAMKTSSEKEIASDKKTGQKDEDSHTHPSHTKRLRGLDMLITYLQAEKQYRECGVITKDALVKQPHRIYQFFVNLLPTIFRNKNLS